ncbi:tectonin beta-propeller repeat-containing protein 2 isoform X2 [Xenopus tropicalis]|uniref:Tectonin beta-propeller repeat-containing protein 2 isoform X2 n=1 Tax=Xenopus tropicalis TaxID=8364 RepID=A0A8J0R719_XENTR|nr:tectonin beta-propeller repeat-containing protein 2 isoform X2 [Xenopus tropicalis]|eukprot:XP_004917231.1 PREDICTED: tectonin beta-propeller repeat-containing protein 2 isoform X2 [Xenopus tropicalis]
MAAQRVGTFKEFCPLYSILNAIPAKVQKGFRSILVYLTALDANSDFIAVGSSIGMLYLYCRHTSQMKKYSLEGKTESISVVKLLSCFDDLVAVGTVSGRVAVFQLVSPLPGRNKQLRRFDVLGIHKSNITALAWSPNGMKLFSGDDRGKIIQSDLDFDKGLCNPSLILEELSSVVQLDYSQKVLLVSTTQRCLLFYTEEKAVKQVGTQPRKSNGKYGACFIPGLCKQSDLKLFASRPGLRLWKSDVHGCVQSTFILKDMFKGLEQFELYPRVETSNKDSFVLSEKHFGLLYCFLHEGWVLSWDEYSIYLIDTVNQAVIGGLESSGDIVSVSCTNNEIFFIKGDREIIRISNMPEGALFASLHSPFRAHTPVFTEDGKHHIGALSEMKENNKIDVQSIKTEKIQLCAIEDEESLLDQGTDMRIRTCSLPADEVKSRSSSTNSIDSGFSLTVTAEPGSPNNGQRPTSQRFSIISNEDFDQELVVKSMKVKKKKKKRYENGLKNQDACSRESTPSTDSPLTLNSDFFSATEICPVSSIDHLSSQESLFSGKNQGVLDNSIDVFSAVQPTETFPTILGNGSNPPAKQTEELLDVNSDNNADPLPPAECDSISAVNLLMTDPLELNVLMVKNNAAFLPEKDPDYIDCCAVDKCPTVLETLSSKNCNIAYGLEEEKPLESNKDEILILDEDQQFQEKSRTWQVSSSFIEDSPLNSTYCTSQSPSNDSEEQRIEGGNQDPMLASSDEEDIYGHRFPHSTSGSSVADVAEMTASQDMACSTQEVSGLLKSEQLAESWMVYSGPPNGILSLVVSEKYIWCLDYKGSLYCSALPGAGLRWQKFEDGVQQVAVSPSGALLWKVEQRSDKAFACGKVTIKGKRHWYEALPQAAFVALSDDTAWIIRTNGDLYLQTGLSVDRPCARAVKVDCPCPLSQITARNHVVWALTEQRGLLFREGVNSFSPEGEAWKCDLISERQALEPVCVTLGDQDTVWILDASGNLWFRSGITAKNPQGEDDHWWQVNITDYVVFDHYTLFQTLLQATQTVATVAQAPVEKVADKLRMTFWSQQPQGQPSLLGVNSSGVWITSGKNEFHVARGNLVGTYWHNIVPRGTASTTKWATVSASASPTAEGNILWISQSRKDLFCLSDLNPPYRPSTVQLPPETEIVHLSACGDAVWALDNHGGVFIRTLSKTCPTGMHWTKLDLSQLGPVTLCSLSCGNQHIWACDTSGVIYFRVGTQPLNPSMMLPAWIMIEPPIQPVGINLIGVYSSPNDKMLWTLDNRCNVYVRVGITEEMPVGVDWEHVPGLQACQLAVSMRTVWARCPNGDIARRYGITEKNSAGDYWKKIPGNMAWFTVTPLDELWAVGNTGYLLQRLTKTYSHYPNIPKHDSVLVNSDFEDEWEVI